jgi:hypothetical protein
MARYKQIDVSPHFLAVDLLAASGSGLYFIG